MRLLITGLSGTLAPVLARVARTQGHAVIGLDHHLLRWAEPERVLRYLHAQRVDAVAHLAMASAADSGALAAWAAANGLPFVVTSTAMVFHHLPDGPHGLQAARTAQDAYGQSKMAVEDAVIAAHPRASVVRIGWQIDAQAHGNNMLRTLDAWQGAHGEVAASRAWRPACSYMSDTAVALLACLDQPGIHHVDSNAEEGWHFAELVAALAHAHARPAWRLRVHADYTHDQRLVGGAVRVPGLSQRLQRPTGC